jgi:hypothetical protein
MDTPTTLFAGPPPEKYGVEVLCASWNPVVAAVVEPLGQACRELLADLSAVDVDAFLRHFYRCQGS